MTSTLIRISAIVVLVSIACIFLVNAAPQLFDEQTEAANDDYIPEALIRTRRRSQYYHPHPPGHHQHGHHHQQPQGSYGHHQPSYTQAAGGGLGGGAEGFEGQQQSQGYGQSSGGHGHGGPVGPVFTFVRTDYHGNFQTGVRHKVGGGWKG